MLLVDDILLKPFVSVLDALHSMAVDELYDVEGIRADIKENQLLYELGERSEAEYERRRAELERELEVAQAARDTLDGKVEVMSG